MGYFCSSGVLPGQDGVQSLKYTVNSILSPNKGISGSLGLEALSISAPSSFQPRVERLVKLGTHVGPFPLWNSTFNRVGVVESF